MPPPNKKTGQAPSLHFYSGRYGRQPLRRFRVPSCNQFVELLLQGAGYRPSLASSNEAEINLAQRNDLCRRAADKNFVGDIELIAGYRFFYDRVTEIASQYDQAVARDALENSGARRGDNNVVANNKKIFAGALGNITIGAEHDRLIKTGALRFSFRQNRTDIISGDLGLGHHDIRMQARERSDVGANATFFCCGPKKTLPLPHRNHKAGFASLDCQAHSAIEKNHGTDVARRKLVRRDGLVDGGFYLFKRERQIAKADDVRRIEQALHVFFHPKNGWPMVS